MPGFDGTGPRGQGTMTGRRMGYCVSVDPTNKPFSGSNFGYGRGRGFGSGLGLGRGRGRCFFSGNMWFSRAGELDPAVQKNYLQNIAEHLQYELNSVKEELNTLEKNAKKDSE